MRKEIEELHSFFAQVGRPVLVATLTPLQWLNGLVPKTEEAFSRFPSVLATDFSIVSSDGSTRRFQSSP